MYKNKCHTKDYIKNLFVMNMAMEEMIRQMKELTAEKQKNRKKIVIDFSGIQNF